jgi:conjugal transfer mating pair stabilization protein TraG
MMFGIWVLIHSIIKGDSMIPLKWMFWVWVCLEVILIPKTTIMIKDPVTQYERHVDNVPYVLGSFASVISGVGHGMTERIETFFSLPDYQKYSEKGPMFASKIMKNMGKYRIRDGNLKENMTRFIKRCVILESLSGGMYTVDDLRTTKDIWDLVKNNANPIIGFSYRGKGGTEILSCKEGVKLIDKDLKDQVGKLSSFMGRQLKLDAKKNTTSQMFGNFFKTEIVDSYHFMSGIADSAENILRQEMMVNAIEDARTSYAVAKSTIQQRSWHHITGELASNMLVTMKIVLEALTYSSFIFVAIMVMLPGGINILGKYFGILMWLQLWAPLYAILNMVLATAARYKTQTMLGGDGLTMLNSVGIAGLHADIEAIAAMCSASIPFISYALLQGGVGSFMHLAGTMTNAMSGSAQSSSNEVTSGNLAMNTVSYGNRSQAIQNGFKHDAALSYKAGRMEMETMSGAMQFATPSGNLHGVGGQGLTTSKLVDTATIGRNMTNSFNSAINSELGQVANYQQSAERSQALVADDSKSLLQAATRNMGQNKSWTIAENSRYADSINKTIQFNENLSKNYGYTEGQAAEVSMALGGSLGFVSAKSNFSSQAAFNDAVQKGRTLAESQGMTQHLEKGTSHMQDVKFSEGMGEEKRLSENLQMNLSKRQSSTAAASHHKSIADRLTQTRGVAQSLGIGINEDATEKLIDFMVEQKLSGRTEPLGRQGAIHFLTNPHRPFDYENSIEAFAKSVYQKQGNDIMQNQNKFFDKDNTPSQKVDYNQRTTENEKNFKTKVGGKNKKGIDAEYGEFNALQAKNPDPKTTNDYFKDKAEAVTKNDVATNNNLEINKDLNNKKPQKKYQTYVTTDGTEVNIKDEARNKTEEVKGKVEQQKTALTTEKTDLNKEYDKSSDRTLAGKATGFRILSEEERNAHIKPLKPVWKVDKEKASKLSGEGEVSTQGQQVNASVSKKDAATVIDNDSNQNQIKAPVNAATSLKTQDNSNTLDSSTTSGDRTTPAVQSKTNDNNIKDVQEETKKGFVNHDDLRKQTYEAKTYAEIKEDEAKKATADPAVTVNNLSSAEQSPINQKLAPQLQSSGTSSLGIANNQSNNLNQNNSDLSVNNPNIGVSVPNYNNTPEAREVNINQPTDSQNSSVPQIKTESLMEDNLTREKPKVITKIVQQENSDSSKEKLDKEAAAMKKLQE